MVHAFWLNAASQYLLAGISNDYLLISLSLFIFQFPHFQWIESLRKP